MSSFLFMILSTCVYSFLLIKRNEVSVLFRCWSTHCSNVIFVKELLSTSKPINRRVALLKYIDYKITFFISHLILAVGRYISSREPSSFRRMRTILLYHKKMILRKSNSQIETLYLLTHMSNRIKPLTFI